MPDLDCDLWRVRDVESKGDFAELKCDTVEFDVIKDDEACWHREALGRRLARQSEVSVKKARCGVNCSGSVYRAEKFEAPFLLWGDAKIGGAIHSAEGTASFDRFGAGWPMRMAAHCSPSNQGEQRWQDYSPI